MFRKRLGNFCGDLWHYRRRAGAGTQEKHQFAKLIERPDASSIPWAKKIDTLGKEACTNSGERAAAF
ncbi:hypothetical protein [Rhodoplanes sp. Z2-YC6860]|uniref:hypothetical protein n=1 Tax=Rhodoplanes sp. Z2-YC6860 TaxID=674703 RepID=UPI0012ED9B8F|nr:hypothetical protein [Rhodoplanes sp. Z2-YC6860]